MSHVQAHYDNLLADHYSWMNGSSFAEKVSEQRNLLWDLGIYSRTNGRAIDLGCGPGYQSFALSDLGFESVIAIDNCRALLDELNALRAGTPIEPRLADMRSFATLVERESVDAIVCMGDTLTHLDDRGDVSKLFRDAHDVLRVTGRLVLTFRDLSLELTGLDRFIPVRADDQRLMVCALDYEPESVVVTDIIHIRDNDGWTLRKSSYRKLRLQPAAVAKELQAIGFLVDQDRSVGRLHAIVARKP
ncbi:class I SAM-dependent methyltransferase [Methylobacterium mesophilicum]|uniref:class I SAM-dependent methyltransferase n=1 Tax=Methylobacterium mesophilicum TaxID=39956 RepID=UPI001EE22F21|nr:class I SAM-dependent methyltransferase [Methylobacterium mesophilicum]GJE23926.1 hypothetical protein JHFBIEKO_4391 [Methylobacterium mesophilicum]